MKASEKIPAWEEAICADRVDACRMMLHIHGFLSESENDRVNARIEKWAAKDGVTRKPVCVTGAQS